jgi:hypothetical protein
MENNPYGRDFRSHFCVRKGIPQRTRALQRPFGKECKPAQLSAGPLGTICLDRAFRPLPDVVPGIKHERLRSRPTPRGWGRFSTESRTAAWRQEEPPRAWRATETDIIGESLVEVLVTLTVVAVCTFAFINQLH